MKSTHSFPALAFCIALLTLCACTRNALQTADSPFLNVPVAKEVVMYEANPRVFAEHNALNAITERLDEIKALGTNVVWLMPIYEQGILKAKSADGGSSPYCIKDYEKIDPEYGTLADLQRLVREAHDRDMAVILDFVANHTSWDNAWIAEHPDWYTHNAAGEIVHPAGTDWTDVADLNFGTPDSPNTALYNAFFDAMKYWFDAANIDGFRCDALNYVPADFCKKMVAEMRLHTAGRRILMLSEGDNKDFFSLGYDMDYSWNFYERIKKLYTTPSYQMASFISATLNELNSTPADKSHLYFTTNHDKSAWEQTDVQLFGSAQAALSAFALTATLADAPLIYSTQEIGTAPQISFFKHTPTDWNTNPDVLAEYKRIMTAYKSSKAFSTGTRTTFTDNPDIVYFTRTSGTETVLVAVNVRNASKTLTIPAVLTGRNAVNLLNNVTIVLPETIDLQPYQYFLWKIK